METGFYDRQLTLREIGPDGQARLKASRVLVIGAGGLGSPVLTGLAGAGVGRIGIVDGDRISESNLNRQYLYTPDDFGQPKASVARERIAKFHPDLAIESYDAILDKPLAQVLFPRYDLIVGAVDSRKARRLINEVCCRLRKPWIDAGVESFNGYATLIVPGRMPCYDCLFGFSGMTPEKPEEPSLPGRHETGILGVATTVVGSFEATMAIGYLLGLPDPLAGEILFYAGRTLETSRLRVERDPDCPACGHLFQREGT